MEYVVATPPGNVAFLLALPDFTEDLKEKNKFREVENVMNNCIHNIHW